MTQVQSSSVITLTLDNENRSDLLHLREYLRADQIIINNLDDGEAEIEIIGSSPQIVNQFRRDIMNLPSMAIEIVDMHTNNSVLDDHVLIHRIGLIPIDCDHNNYEVTRVEDFDENGENHFQFSLDVVCPIDNDGNMTVTSSDIVPPLCMSDIPITVLCPGESISLDMIALKNYGNEHGKFRVAHVWYRMMPIPILKGGDITSEEEAKKIIMDTPKGLYGYKLIGNGKALLYVKDQKKCTRKSEHYDITYDRNHIIFNIESIGMMKIKDILNNFRL